jgi:hypothetical protein
LNNPSGSCCGFAHARHYRLRRRPAQATSGCGIRGRARKSGRSWGIPPRCVLCPRVSLCQ